METISLSSQEAVGEVRLKSPDIPPAREGGVSRWYRSYQSVVRHNDLSRDTSVLQQWDTGPSVWFMCLCVTTSATSTEGRHQAGSGVNEPPRKSPDRERRSRDVSLLYMSYHTTLYLHISSFFLTVFSIEIGVTLNITKKYLKRLTFRDTWHYDILTSFIIFLQ